jgi:hypothetical protein
MNGARQRLNVRFGAVPKLRGRFVCLTFDSFAHRRRSLLRSLPAPDVKEEMSVFDRTCLEAARLLELPEVTAWLRDSSSSTSTARSPKPSAS